MIELYASTSTWTFTNTEGKKALLDLLTYAKTDYVQIPGLKAKRVTTNVRMIYTTDYKDQYLLHTGFLPKIEKFLKAEGLEYNLESNIPEVQYDTPQIEGGDFRDYQLELIEKALDNGRGVIKAATGAGKSFVIAGLVSAFSEENILILVHTTDLAGDLLKAVKKAGLGPASKFDKNKKTLDRITVSTIQAFHRHVEPYKDFFDCTIVDECHHVSSEEGMYGKTLAALSAPVKFGTTATLPESKEAKFSLEAFIGPIIGEYTIQDAAEEGILAEPHIYIRKMPVVKGVVSLKDYKKVYELGIVFNIQRNMQIVKDALDIMKQGRTVLILVVRLDHGKELARAFKHYGQEVPFVQGTTKKECRTQVIDDLKSGAIKAAIASVVFVEGIDIPNLGAVINAAGEKSETRTVQKVGRGLRKTNDKKDVWILDYHDQTHVYLTNHYRKRLEMYQNNNWKVTEIENNKK